MGQVDDARVAKRDRKSGKAKPAKTSAFVKAEFVNLELSDEQRLALKAQVLDLGDCDDALLKLNEAGYGLKLKWDAYSESFAAFLQTDDEADENYGFILTGRGSTPLKALKQILYKYYVICEGEFWKFAKKPSKAELDD
jgi:hypothetical protein